MARDRSAVRSSHGTGLPFRKFRSFRRGHLSPTAKEAAKEARPGSQTADGSQRTLLLMDETNVCQRPRTRVDCPHIGFRLRGRPTRGPASIRAGRSIGRPRAESGHRIAGSGTNLPRTSRPSSRLASRRIAVPGAQVAACSDRVSRHRRDSSTLRRTPATPNAPPGSVAPSRPCEDPARRRRNLPSMRALTAREHGHPWAGDWPGIGTRVEP